MCNILTTVLESNCFRINPIIGNISLGAHWAPNSSFGPCVLTHYPTHYPSVNTLSTDYPSVDTLSTD